MSKVFEIAFKLGGELTSSFKKAFGDADGAMKMLGAAAATVGGAAAFTAMAGEVMEMNDALTKLSAQTGTYGADMKELGKIAENVFKTGHGESFDDVTAALQQVKQNMQGLDNGELERVTGNAMMLADTFDADVNEVTRGARGLMTGFGIDAETAFDLMARGAQEGLNFSDDLFDQMAEFGPLWGGMGFSVEEMFGKLVAGAENGSYQLDYLNDIMKEYEVKTTMMDKSTVDAFKSMSKEAQSAYKQFSNGEITLADLNKVVSKELSSMEDQTQAFRLGVDILGTKFEDLGQETAMAFLSSQNTMDDFEGSMQKINEVRFDTVGAALEGINRTLMIDVVKPLGDAVLPYLNDFASFLQADLPSAVEQSKGAIKEYGPIMLGVGAAFVAFKVAMQTATTYQKAFNLVQLITPKLLYAQRTAMLAYTFAGGGLRGVLVALRSGMAALNLTMLANPFGLAVVAIAALVGSFVILYQKSETFRTAMQPLIATLKVAFFDALTQVKSAFTAIVPAITNIANMALPLLISAVQMIIPVIVTIVQTAVPIVVALLGLISGIIQNAVIPALNYLMPVVQAVFSYIQVVITNALTIVNGIIQAAMALINGDWSGAWNIIKGTAETIMNNIIGFFRGINLFEVGKSIINGLINGIKSMGGAVIGAITNMVPEPLRAAAGGVMSALGIGGYATGGIVSSPELAWVGEGGDTEAIIPWNNSQRSRDLWLRTGQALGMLNKSGAIDNMQQQIAMKAASNGATPIVSPSQVRTPSGGGSIIHLHYNPQYSVQNPDDLAKVKVHADKDKDDLEARLAEIKRNTERTSFDD